MRAWLILSILAATLLPSTYANDKNQGESELPVAFGMLSNNSACVIFREIHKTSAKFYGVAVATRTVTELEVVEAQHYSLDRKLWTEKQEDKNELQRLAVKDKVKFVKIPNKNPTEEQLEEARAMCNEPSDEPHP
ncbi:MAG: hypothetical protein ABSD20_01105 [Terriglobales bacterium]|jgi:hypothetical protein